MKLMEGLEEAAEVHNVDANLSGIELIQVLFVGMPLMNHQLHYFHSFHYYYYLWEGSPFSQVLVCGLVMGMH